MKQLKDGGLAFYTDQAQGLKKIVWSFPCFLFLSLFLICALPDFNLTTRILISLIVCLGIISLALGTILILKKFTKVPPICTIYQQYITWKDSQDNILGKEKKLFFKDLYGFFITTETLHFYLVDMEEEVICFVMKDPQIKVPFYPYFTWLNKQDQKLLVELLKDKGLVQLPEPDPKDYKPN